MWHAASLELNDDGWPRNQGVSVGSIPLRETHPSDGRRIIESALVDEISITSTPTIGGAWLLAPTADRTSPGRQRIPSASATATPRKNLIRRNCGETSESESTKPVRKREPPAPPPACGWGYHHRQRRRQLEPLVRAGALNCARCGRRIQPHDQWQLDLSDNRDGYVGASHASCNARAGAHKANRNRHRGLLVTRIWSRRWTDVAESGTVVHLANQSADYYDGDNWRAVSTRELAL
jgi:hypothetical protein